MGNCGRRCESDTRCMGFNMDYNRNECQAVIKNSKNNLFNLRPSSGVSFFEAICLKGKVTFTNTFYMVKILKISSEQCKNHITFISQGRSCGKSWTFERVVDMELTGYIKETVRGITKTAVSYTHLTLPTILLV